MQNIIAVSKRWIILMINLMIPVIIILYTSLLYRNSFLNPYIIGLAGSMGLMLCLSSFFNNRISIILKSTVIIFNITYVLLELTTSFLLNYGIIRSDMAFYFSGIHATDKRIAQFDSVCGYRGVPGRSRYLSIENGKVEMDLIRNINEQGWFSFKNYSCRKTPGKTKRYMVLGDSYSSGVSSGTAWPDITQDIMRKNGNDSVELYNFSQEGVGIVNWYYIFFNELLPKYDFDGIIIATSSEKTAFPDLDRKLMMMHSYEDATYIAVTDSSTISVPLKFPKDKALPAVPIYSSADLDRIKKNYVRQKVSLCYTKHSLNLWFLAILFGVSDGIKKALYLYENSKVYNQPYENYYKMAGKSYKMDDFEARYKYSYLLKEIIARCKKDSKEVILIDIPDYENAIDFVNKRDVICRKELSLLSEQYHLKHFDGFDIMQGQDSAFVETVFYEYDRHWNKKGVDLFSEKLAKSSVFISN